MASFTKTPSGAWKATISAGKDYTGKQIRYYVTKPLLKEAKAEAARIEQELQENRLDSIPDMNAAKYFQKWLSLHKNSYSPSTYKSYKMYINTHFIPVFGNYKLSKINHLHIQQYINEKLETLSANTVRKHYFVLNKIMKEALDQRSPFKRLKPPKDEDSYEYVILTEDDFNKLHEVVKNTYDELPVLLAAWCGLREGEIFNIKYENINIEAGTLNIKKALSISDDEGYIEKNPKSKRGKREIALPDRIIELFKALPEGDPEDRIFNIKPGSYSERFGKIIDKNKLLDHRFHDLRHYHATQLYAHGFPDQFAAQRLGQSVHVLKGVYQHLDNKAQQKSDTRIPEAFKEKRTEKRMEMQHTGDKLSCENMTKKKRNKIPVKSLTEK